jgi:PAS domain S-box-containing protein
MPGGSTPAQDSPVRRAAQARRRRSDSAPDSEQRLRAIIDTAVDAIITIDERGTIESANASTERLFGFRRSELIGRSVSILMPSPYREEHDHYVRCYVATGKANIIGIGREVVGQRKDGSRIPIHLSVSEVLLERGRLFTAVIHDLSERRRLEKEVLAASAREQERIGRELHDGVCQNLVGTALAVSALAKRLATDAPDVHAEARQAEALAALIRQTATQVRNLSHGLSPLDVSADGLPVALQKLAQQVTETSGLRCTFGGGGKGLVPSYDAATANHLYRISQEAVNNAIRHAQATAVHVQLEADGHGIVLSVRDNGTGFPRKIGKGLGLETMAYRARMIGGALSIERGADGGTTVRCVVHEGNGRQREK